MAIQIVGSFRWELWWELLWEFRWEFWWEFVECSSIVLLSLSDMTCVPCGGQVVGVTSKTLEMTDTTWK